MGLGKFGQWMIYQGKNFFKVLQFIGVEVLFLREQSLECELLYGIKENLIKVFSFNIFILLGEYLVFSFYEGKIFMK